MTKEELSRLALAVARENGQAVWCLTLFMLSLPQEERDWFEGVFDYAYGLEVARLTAQAATLK